MLRLTVLFILFSPDLTTFLFFFFNDTATTEIYTLSLHGRSSDLFSTGPQPQLTAFLYAPKEPRTTRPDGSPVIFYSGDWGWMPMQQDAASYLASTGRFVLGIDSAQFFTSVEPRDVLTADLGKFRSFV